MKQTSPCQKCGKIAGWWQPINPDLSMTFYAPNGEELENRINHKKRKHCANCDTEITGCISIPNGAPDTEKERGELGMQ